MPFGAKRCMARRNAGLFFAYNFNNDSHYYIDKTFQIHYNITIS